MLSKDEFIELLKYEKKYKVCKQSMIKHYPNLMELYKIRNNKYHKQFILDMIIKINN